MKAQLHRRVRKPIVLSLILVGLVIAMMALMGVMQLQAASSAIVNAAFPAQQDAYVRSPAPDSNLGAGPIGVEPNTRGYVQFDISALPPSATILEARLRMKPSSFAGVPPMTVGLGQVNASWNEGDVTWNTRPAVTGGGPTTNVANLDWVSWDVTSLVQAWYTDPTTNYGFVLATQDPGVFFHSKEDGPAPQLFVRFEVADEPRPRPDLGDAPDSTNHLGLPSPAYAGPVAGQFPTVWDGPLPSGPRHNNLTGEMFLGNYISAEAEADQGPDQDGPNNLQANGGLLIPNRDRADDGWLNRNVAFPNCRRTALTVRVSRAATSTLETAYLNVFFDGNRDGDWADVGGCEADNGQQSRSYEWIVQNFAIDMTGIPAGGYRDITVNSLLVHNTAPDRPHWVRFMLSEAQAPEDPAINRADGRGPAAPNAFAFGETEDYFYEPQPQGQPGELLIHKRVISDTNPVEYAGTVTYQINVKHEGGTEPIAAEIRDLLTFPQHILGAVEVTEVMTGVTPLFATVDYQRDPQNRVNTLIRWQGTLAPNAEIQISFPVHIHPLCQPNQQTQEIVNTAQVRSLSGGVISDTVSFRALCPGVSIDDITVRQIVPEDNRDLDTSAAAANKLGNFEIQDFRKIPVQTIFTNKGIQPATVGFMVEISGVNAGAAAADTDTRTLRRTGVLTLEPGESATVENIAETAALFGSAFAEIPADPAVDLEIESSVKFAVLPLDLANVAIETLDPGQIGTQRDKFKVRPWDVGDAPDSSNHFAVAMTAYPGVPAGFPTVFDPATGTPEGPAHARPRPFHLGAAVDLERDADLAPAPRNIVPPANIANQDNFDDGANPNAWALAHCRSAVVPVRVFISPAAVAWLTANNNGIGYLNSWIDGNRDGSWDDAVECTNASGQNSKWAPEHIIIDEPINVAALGAGLHTLTVNTGLVPWPADKAEDPAWVRLTLSERPSNKTFTTPDGTVHGDGRGYAVPFRTGETEDYLRRANLNGPDMGVNVQLRWEPVFKTGTSAAAMSLNFEEIKVTFRTSFANLGDQTALGARLTLTVPSGLNISNVQSLPELNANNIVREGNRVTINLGDVDANSRGWILIESIMPTSALVNNEVIEGFFAAVSSENDVNPDNNQASTSLTVEMPGARVGVKSPWMDFLVRGGTTCSTNVVMAGTGIPDSELVVELMPLHDHDHADINASAVVTHWPRPLTATVKVGLNGRWATTWSGLGNGSYSGGVVGRGSLGRSADLDKSSPKLQQVRFNVASELRIDPMSLAFEDAKGRIFHPNTLGWAREQWQVRLPNGTYTVGINVCQQTDNLQITVQIAGIGPVELKDENNDGRYEGEVTIGAPTAQNADARSDAAVQTVSLTVVTDGAETVYSGAVESVSAGQVKDIVTNAGIADASLTLVAENEDVYAAWNGEDYGQGNPQSSAADGSYLFAVPTGSYFVTATKDGYQPYRTNAVDATDVVNEVFSLTPVVVGEAETVIAITENGFSPASVAVKPGSIVKFVNTDINPHNVTTNINRNSGILFSGESYTVTVGESGSISLSDSSSPTFSGVITIDPNAGQSFLYLPAVEK
ncbi:DNRLRE domain-containing protein [bacterium]|nr:DNRLRE domain-containing protein [bacterium]